MTFNLFVYFDICASSSSSSEAEGSNYQKICFIENLSKSHCLGGQIKEKHFKELNMKHSCILRGLLITQ